jgi:hypothetical protein
MSDPLDLSEYETAASAAKRLHKYLTEELDADAHLYRPEDNPRENGAWGVAWEGGPYKWAVHLTGGESLFTGELGRVSDPEVTGFRNENWTVEPHFGFDLQFFNRRRP